MSSGVDLDEAQLVTRIAHRDLWRLIQRAQPYRLAMAVCLVLAVSAILCDLAVPWATKVIIDRALAPPWRVVEATSALRDHLRAQGALALDGGALMVDAGTLAQADALDLTHEGKVQRCIELAPTDGTILPVLTCAGRRFLPVDELAGSTAAERLHLRRGQVQLLVDLAGVLLGVLVVRFLVNIVLGRLLRSTGQRIITDLRTEVIGHLLRLPASFYDAQPVGRLVTRATNDIAAVEELFTGVLITVIRDCLMIVGGMALLILLEWRLALAVVSCSPLVLLISWVFRKRSRAINRELRSRLSQLNSFLAESLTGWRTVQASAQEVAMQARFATINQAEYLTGLRQMRHNGLFLPLIAFTGTVCAAVVLLIGGHAVSWGWLTIGGLVAFMSYIEMAFAPIRDLAEKYNLTQAAVAAGERIFVLLDQPQEQATGTLRPPQLGTLCISGVSFRYPGRSGGSAPPWVLEQVSFTVAPGERIALVGATGSGKSTLASLLVRSHDPQQGRITADGIDLRDCDRAWLRSRIATVSQDVQLYAGTMADNLTLFRPCDESLLLRSAAAVHADRVLARLPGGLAHRLGERGGTISSGERQLIALARAIIHDPELLILDEATAHIDSQTEALVQDGLRKLLSGRSAVIIAHRLSTIRSCDRILVLHHGRIVESGSHAELLAAQGRYAELHRQFVAEEALEQRT